MTKIEKNIEALEKTVTEKETLLFQPDVYQDHKKANAINQEIKEIREEIDKLMEEWAAFAENIHELNDRPPKDEDVFLFTMFSTTFKYIHISIHIINTYLIFFLMFYNIHIFSRLYPQN